MTKTIISQIEFDYLVDSLVLDVKNEFIFTFRNSRGCNSNEHCSEDNPCVSGCNCRLYYEKMDEVSDLAWKEDLEPYSVSKWKELEKIEKEKAIKRINSEFVVQKFDKFGIPIHKNHSEYEGYLNDVE